MINPARFGCAIYGAKDKVLEFCKYPYSSFQRDCKEGESGTIFEKYVLRNEL